MTLFIAELRDWVKCAIDRDTFQGFIFNDQSHTHENGKFLTIEADNVDWTAQGCIVQSKKHLYYLWNSFKKDKR